MAVQSTLTSETEQERDTRLRNGRVAMITCIVLWVVVVGGIIYMLNVGR